MMRQNFPFLQPDIWLQQIFDSRAARSGGIVRRKVRDVERILGRAAFIAEIQRRLNAASDGQSAPQAAL
ncbi:MAG: hypothetical protein CSA68_04845 [Rhodobacterales bacterium]|nr:MAG: hypothetical protein CSA68_04845 [Rhodobacterales bacterium]